MTPTPPDPSEVNRRQAAQVLVSGGALIGAAALPAAPAHAEDPPPGVAITCFIRYQIDPFQREAFKTYAANWGRIIPRCGGHLVGYFLPDVGTNDIAWGLIAFSDLGAYDAYRARLQSDPEARENFETAQRLRLILREERTFVRNVPGTFERPALS